jgi:hypothetical protein
MPVMPGFLEQRQRGQSQHNGLLDHEMAQPHSKLSSSIGTISK